MSYDFIDVLFDDIKKKQKIKASHLSSSVKRSNKAHARLENKAMRHSKYKLMSYHNLVSHVQFEENRVITRSERRKLFKSIKQ